MMRGGVTAFIYSVVVQIAFLVVVDGAPDPAPYSLDLTNIFISHGVLSPEFAPTTKSYTVNLVHALDQIAITPEVDQSRPEYAGGEMNLPVITMKWKNRMNNKPESASIAVRRQIDLPDEGESLDVYIEVANPHMLSDMQTYSVRIYQSKSEPVVALKSLEAVDDNGRPVLILPLTSQDDVLYDAYASPDTESISLRPSCADGNWVTLDGRTVTNKRDSVIARQKDHHRQLVEITCGKGTGIGSSVTKKYVLSIFSDFASDDIPPPRLVVNGRGKDCVFSSDKQQYNCPNPKAQDYRVRVTGFSEPSIRYTVESTDQSVQVRLLDETPSIPFSYTGVGRLNVIGTAGQHEKSWPLVFNGAPAPGFMRVLGWLLGLKLAVLLLSLLGVLGLSNLFGIGTPIGVTEIATAMTLLLQFFCFTSALRGASLLTDMTEAMKWVTLYWPLPWNVDSHSNSLARWGDCAELTNAYGCLFWAKILFAIIALFHMFIAGRVKFFQAGTTFPHRLAFGNWEQRCLHWLCFPVCTAAAMVLKHPDSTAGWKAVAGIDLSLFVAWAIYVFVTVRSSISSKKVIWVWQSSVREDGELEDEAGYWSDIHCDQLLTQPVNRSLFKWFFPWRWVTTVADIDPINICPRMFARGDEENEGLYPVNEFQRGHKEASYPLGKNPKMVDIYRTMAPNNFCPGQRLIAGLMRTDWLDILFTYQGLTRFHTSMSKDTRDFIIPVTVKTCQLTGPYTGGLNHFFYDGTKIPFIRIGDSMYRLVIGVLLGLSLSSESYKLDSAVYGSIGALSVGLLVYHVVGKPYTRLVENWILGALLFTIASTSFSFMGYSIKGTGVSVIADIFLWLTAITSFLLWLYACLVIFSVYSAIMCPPLEETRFLEKLANCNVTISDHESNWAVDVPAYNKNGARDLKAQCSVGGGSKLNVSVYPSGEEATIEFGAQEMLQACRSGSLRAPILSLFSPDSGDSLGYRHTNVYDKRSVQADVASFLASDRNMRHMADHIARNIAHQVEVRGRGKAVISMTIVPPKNASGVFDDGDSVSHGRNGGARQRSRPASIEMSAR